jgi:hypothetical protein
MLTLKIHPSIAWVISPCHASNLWDVITNTLLLSSIIRNAIHFKNHILTCLPNLNQYPLTNYLIPIKGQDALFTCCSGLVHLHSLRSSPVHLYLHAIRPCSVAFTCIHLQSLAITLHSLSITCVHLQSLAFSVIHCDLHQAGCPLLKVIRHTSCKWLKNCMIIEHESFL